MFFGKSHSKAGQDLDKSRKNDSQGTIKGSGQGYYYLTGIVREFISEPDAYIINRSGKMISLANEDYDIMTKNCIIAHIIDRSGSRKGKKPVLCFPFFPHLGLPIKPGEHVWVLKEENEGRDLYYWVSRKVGIKQTEDVNYTQSDRLALIDDKLKTRSGQNNDNKGGDLFNTKDPFEKRDFVSTDFVQENLPQGLSLNGIAKDSIAYNNEFTAEPVPPIKKKCGDAILMGSNNSHVHLTTEKFILSQNDATIFSGLSSNPPGKRVPFSPAIDLCVGRKFKELSALLSDKSDEPSSGPVSLIKTKRGKSFQEYETYEIDKVTELFTPGQKVRLKDQRNDYLLKNESFNPELSIDSDATNCGARIYLSNNSAIDSTFGTAIDDLDSHGGPSLATYASHNRVVADESLRLVNRLGRSYIEMDSEGKIRLQGKTKIELAVREDNETPSEPYVLYSELKDLLEKITGDLAFYHMLIEEILLPAIPFGIGTSIKQSLESAREAAAAGGDVEINTPEIPGVEETEDTDAIPPVPAGTISVPSTLLGGNIKIAEYTDIAEQISGKLPSTKIFGESND